jgi:ketosteroid isomerase-like protein
METSAAIDSTAAIELERRAFVEAVGRRDARAIAELYADDARLVAPGGGPVRGRGEVAAFWRAGVDSGIVGVTLDPDDVEVVPTVAWEVGRYELRVRADDGDVATDRGRYLLVYGFDGSRWRRTAEMFRPDTAARRPE